MKTEIFEITVSLFLMSSSEHIQEMAAIKILKIGRKIFSRKKKGYCYVFKDIEQRGDKENICLWAPFSKDKIGINHVSEGYTMIESNYRIKFNISGFTYETFSHTLNRFPDTLLGNPKSRRQLYDPLQSCYFINRSQAAFEAILYYYQSHGRLVRPPFIPMPIFEGECLFYELDIEAIRAMKEKEGYNPEKRVDITSIYKHRLKHLWVFLEHPESSHCAQLYMIISLSCIFLLLTLDCAETIPDLFTERQLENVEKTKFILITCFAVEYVARVVSCPSIIKFLKTFQNIVDFFAIFPTYIIFFVTTNQLSGIVFTRVLRSFRVFRLMTLSKQFESISVVLDIFVNSISNLLLLVFCMFISITLFGSMLYYAEASFPGTPIKSVPEGMWLAMQTVVSVGYGDVIPVSIVGKIMASVTAVIGALTMTLPLLSLGGKYFSIYTRTFNVALSENLSKSKMK